MSSNDPDLYKQIRRRILYAKKYSKNKKYGNLSGLSGSYLNHFSSSVANALNNRSQYILPSTDACILLSTLNSVSDFIGGIFLLDHYGDYQRGALPDEPIDPTLHHIFFRLRPFEQTRVVGPSYYDTLLAFRTLLIQEAGVNEEFEREFDFQHSNLPQVMTSIYFFIRICSLFGHTVDSALKSLYLNQPKNTLTNLQSFN